MDDRRIRELKEEVLGVLQGRAQSEPGSPDLPSRVSALERAVQRLERSAGSAPPGPAPAADGPTAVLVQTGSHPSLHVLNVPGGTDRCVLEPDKPCVKSGACRTYGF
jgi:hypothetical protein